MDNRYYEKVIEEMQPFLDEQGFKAQENGNFKNDKREIKIAYDEGRQNVCAFRCGYRRGRRRRIKGN